MHFTTVDQVQAFLNREELTPSQASTVQMLIGLVDGVICNYCGWQMLATAYTAKRFNGTGLSELDLRVYPLNEVTKVLLDGVEITDTVELISDEGLLALTDGSTFSEGTRNVVVDFNGGFDPENIPSELAQPWASLQYAATYLVAINFTRIDAENIGVASEKFNQVEVKYDPTDIPVLVKRVLDRFRRVSIF